MQIQTVNEHTITELVLAEFQSAPNARTGKIHEALVRHLHAFLREVEPSEAEWLAGIEFLTATGKACTDVRQEFILLSDALGASALMDCINHRLPSTATPSSLRGPFFLDDSPVVDHGSDIAGGMPGTLMYFSGRVLDADDGPISEALVDVWHADGEGFYDVVRPGYRAGETAMRARLRTDDQGRFAFRSVVPAAYPLPADGPVADLLRAAARSSVRPAHVHVSVTAPDFQALTTMLFVAGDAHLSRDPVFGVRNGLVHAFDTFAAGLMPDGQRSDAPFVGVEHDFRLAPLAPTEPPT